MVEVVNRVGPGFDEVRPIQSAAGGALGTGFPVYPDLAEWLREPETDPASGLPDSTTAHVLAVLATYAYSDLDTLLEIATRLGLEQCRGVAVTFANDPQFIRSTAYLLQSRDGRVGVLVYRGTEPVNVINWLTDVDVTPERIDLGDYSDGAPSMAVHAGFYRNVRATRFKIAEALLAAVEGTPIGTAGDVPADADTFHPMEALYLTGHSLGGAMAALMAILVREDKVYWDKIGPILKAVYTFGQPMVGSPDLARHYDADDVLGVRTFRYVYEGDPVPRLPSRDTGSWAHFGHEYHHLTGLRGEGWNATGRRVGQIRFIGHTVLAFSSLPLSQLVLLGYLPVQYRIDDHRPHRYIAALTPPGRVSEFGDHPYATTTLLATRARREVEQALRRIFEVPSATADAAAGALGFVSRRLH